ncbi:uncharacterized protein LOC144145260 [Haemaphysalis longicornis]
MMFVVFLLTILSVLSLGTSCKVDHREAVLYATRFGRASQKVFRDCIPMLIKVKPPAPNDLASRFLKSVCDAGQECGKTLKTTDMQLITPCVIDEMWKMWGDHPMYSFETKKEIEKGMVCAANASDSAIVAWLVTDMALRITG